MKDVSLLEINLQRRSEQLELAKLFTPAAPWSEKESTKAAVQKRRKAAESFAAFDDLYFPPESYGDQYAPANAFHAHVAGCAMETDRRVNVIVGPHDHAKSATVYKVLLWAALYGQKHFIGIASETLETPTNLITALSHYLHTNARIRHDWPDLEFLADSQDRLHVTTHVNPRGTVFQGYSEAKSTRGKNTSLFFRFDLLVIEDLENRNSSLTDAAVTARLLHLAEFQSSLGENGCMIVTANNFDVRCAVNRLVTAYEKGELEASWSVYVFPAWGKYYDARGHFHLRSACPDTPTDLQPGPLWKQRYPVTSETELRALLKPYDDATWGSSYQQRPSPPAGDFFSRAHLHIYDTLPDDLMGVINSDQNLARKGRGDKTAMGALLWSQAEQQLYIYGVNYRSYADSNETFRDMQALLYDCIDRRIDIVGVGMEGHVNQESHWQQHVENYMARNQVMLPPIWFHRYNIEIEAKQAQIYWTNGQIQFDAAWIETDEGKSFLSDVLAFTGRKLPGGRDDAPDWLIKSVKMLLELYVIVDLSSPGTASSHGAITRIGRSGRFNFGSGRLGRM